MIDDVERMLDAFEPHHHGERVAMQLALIACHRSRTPSPEEVEAVARAMAQYNMSRAHWEQSEFTRIRYRNMARAALAASDAWRARELEKLK